MEILCSLCRIFEKSGATFVSIISNKDKHQITSNTNLNNVNELYFELYKIKNIVFVDDIVITERLLGRSAEQKIIPPKQNIKYDLNLNHYGIIIICKFKKHILKYYEYYFKSYDLNIKRFKTQEFKEAFCDKLSSSKSERKIKNNKDIIRVKYHKEVENSPDKLIKLIGQFNKEFIIISINNDIIILDQHAAHERIRLEILLNVRHYENNDIKYIEKCKSRACRGAIKFGDVLNIDEMIRILKDLFNCQFPDICAHGRPSILKLANKYAN